MSHTALPAMLISALGVSSLTAQGFPAKPPVPAPLRAATYPAAQEATLANGLRILVLENHRQPVLSLVLTLPAGSAYDPIGKEGVAEMVAGLLVKGAGDRGADEIVGTVESVGGSVTAVPGPDVLAVQADMLSSQSSLAFELLGDVVLRPSFELAQLEVLRQQSTAALQNELSEPRGVATRLFALGIYGTHPYGRRATPESIAGITRDDLTSFHQARFVPRGATLVVAGDITLTAVRDLAEKTFGQWRGAAPAAAWPDPPARTRTEVILVHRPGASGATITLGNTTFAPADSSFLPAQIGARILGGGSDSRLERLLAEQHHWSENSDARLTRPRSVGAFEVSLDVPTEVVDSALRTVLAEQRKIASVPVTAAELDAAKSELEGSFPLGLQTASQLAGAVADARSLGLPANYFDRFRARVSGATSGLVTRAARRTFRADASLIVVVGDGALLYQGLAKLGPVRIVSTEGRPLTPTDLLAKKGPLALDLAQLRPRKDSLIVMVRGHPAGTQVATMERTPTGYRYREESNITGFVSQTTTVDMDSLAAVRHVVQLGKLQGKDTHIDLTYDGFRVKGNASVVNAHGPQTFEVDTTVPAGILDDNMIQGLLPALPWSGSARWDLEVFASGENRVRQLSLTVTGIGTVAVPAGEFECYQAELSGGDQHVAFYITTAAPHRLIRIAIANTPVEFVTAN